jgi:hypothetical protein
MKFIAPLFILASAVLAAPGEIVKRASANDVATLGYAALARYVAMFHSSFNA